MLPPLHTYTTSVVLRCVTCPTRCNTRESTAHKKHRTDKPVLGCWHDFGTVLAKQHEAQVCTVFGRAADSHNETDLCAYPYSENRLEYNSEPVWYSKTPYSKTRVSTVPLRPELCAAAFQSTNSYQFPRSWDIFHVRVISYIEAEHSASMTRSTCTGVKT
jgi:hypothetical protein